jgi:hypothetical protein
LAVRASNGGQRMSFCRERALLIGSRYKVGRVARVAHLWSRPLQARPPPAILAGSAPVGTVVLLYWRFFADATGHQKYE